MQQTFAQIRRGTRVQRGQAMIETVLALVFLLVVIMGLFDFGRAYFMDASLNNGVNEGVRYATLDRSEANIRTRTKAYAGTLTLSDADISITCYSGSTVTTKTCSSAISGDTVEVSATTALSPYTLLIGNIVGTTIALTAKSRKTIQ